MSKIQGADIKNSTEIVSAGATIASLPTDDQIYLGANSINKTLRNAIIDGDLSGGGGINYILNPNAASSTTGWATYSDTPGALPVDGTGGSPASTFTRSTTTPLRGAASFLWTKSAANRQGEGFSYDFAIDAADKAKVLQVSFDYFIASGTYADSDLTVYIYDVTNALVIQPSGYVIQNALVQMKQSATFQTASNSTSYRLIIHTASTSASAYSLQFDNFAVGPQIVTQGAAITDWKYEISTIRATTTNPTKGTTVLDKMWWHQSGGDMEIRFEYTQTSAGSGGSGAYLFKIPNNMSVDPARITASFDMAYGGPVVGSAKAYNGGSETTGVVSLSDTGTNNLMITINNNFVGDGTSGFFAPLSNANAWYTFTAKVPILGWSSNIQLSSDTDTRVVAASYACNTGQTLTAAGIIKFNLKNADTHGAYNTTTGVYTVPVSGVYKISYSLFSITATSQASTLIRKNSGNVARSTWSPTYSGGTSIVNNQSVGLQTPFIASFNAGDTIDIYNDAAIGVGNLYASSIDNYLSIERLSGPSTIAASESISFAANTSTTAATTSQCFIYTVEDHDTHDAYSVSTGKFTAPSPGKYAFQWNNYTGATAAQGILYKNGAAVVNGSQSISNTSVGSGSTTINLLAGDTVEIRPETTATASGVARLNCFSGFRVNR